MAFNVLRKFLLRVNKPCGYRSKFYRPIITIFWWFFFFRKGRVSGKNLVCWNKNVEVTFHLLYNSVQFSCYKKKWRRRKFYYFYWNDLKFRISNHAYCTFARNKIVESKGKKEKRRRRKEEVDIRWEESRVLWFLVKGRGTEYPFVHSFLFPVGHSIPSGASLRI